MEQDIIKKISKQLEGYAICDFQEVADGVLACMPNDINILFLRDRNFINQNDCRRYKAFIKNTQKASETYNNRFTYSFEEYVNSRTPLKIYDTVTEKYFYQNINNHLRSLPKEIKDFQTKNKNYESFLLKSKEAHGERYDYSEVNYINSCTGVKIICKIHGPFLQRPGDHVNGHGCPKCKNLISNEDFILKCKTVHPEYDYSKTNYTHNLNNVTVSCHLHGDFEVRAGIFAKGFLKCPSCEKEKRLLDFNKGLFVQNNRLKAIDVDGEIWTILCNTHGEFKYVRGSTNRIDVCPGCASEKANVNRHETLSVKQELYVQKLEDISKATGLEFPNFKFKKVNGNIDVYCKKHGLFSAKLYNILNGSGCAICNAEQTRKDSGILDFYMEKIKGIFPEYDFSKSVYVNTDTEIIVKCPDHGEFMSTPKRLVQRHGCPYCTLNRPENEIHEILKSLTNSEILLNNRKLIAPYEADFYIPEFNLAIEFNGSFWHHSSDVPFAVNEAKPKDYHYNKWKMCKDAGVTLITINDFLWCQPNKKEIFISKFKHFLNLDERIFARKCTISEIDKGIANDFYEENHIEGSGVLYSDDKSLGLFYGDRLVMCISAGYFYNQSIRSKEFKVRRVCTLKGVTVIGGVTKMISAIKKSFEEESAKFQFTLSTGGNIFSIPSDSTITFRYYWVDPDTMNYYHRNYCQKHLLEKHFGNKLLDNDTESSYMQRLGYMKIHDSGVVSLTI